MWQIELIGNYPSNYKPTITNYGTVDDTNLSQILKVKTGARVMTVMKVNTADPLVNGSLGIVEDIVSETDGRVKYIVIKFDAEKAEIKQRKKYAHISDKYKVINGTPIFRSKIRYHLSGSKKRVHAAKATVLQFPIKLTFALTGHKMQGQTIKKGSKVVVNLSKQMPPALA